MHTIYLFKRDLRLQDNLAIKKILELQLPSIFLYIYDFDDFDDSPKPFSIQDERCLGGASRWWLHYSLNSLASSIKTNLNTDLIIQKGSTILLLEKIFQTKLIKHLVTSKELGVYATNHEANLRSICEKYEVKLTIVNNSSLLNNFEIYTNQNNYYKVYTAFWKHISTNLNLIKPYFEYHLNEIQVAKDHGIQGISIDQLNLLPIKPNWAENFHWVPGETQAHKNLTTFLQNSIQNYKSTRDFPELDDGTSKLSPHLAFGEIAPWRIFYEVIFSHNPDQHKERINSISDAIKNPHYECFLKELVWREFSYYLLYHFPELPYKNFTQKFDNIAWQNDMNDFRSWQNSLTGFPIIDAAMRQLWQTGWIHNRVRMVVGSILIKNLLVDWRFGARYFMDTLVDYDLASNSFNWQWVAGTGADSSPYFRVFNPILQSQKFDPDANFIKKYLPNLIKLAPEKIHDPYQDPVHFKPIIKDWSDSRKKTLEAYKNISS
jgi:deoxyribodipyrimidine photo-lyase